MPIKVIEHPSLVEIVGTVPADVVELGGGAIRCAEEKTKVSDSRVRGANTQLHLGDALNIGSRE